MYQTGFRWSSMQGPQSSYLTNRCKHPPPPLQPQQSWANMYNNTMPIWPYCWAERCAYLTPLSRRVETASATRGRGGSCMATRPQNTRRPGSVPYARANTRNPCLPTTGEQLVTGDRARSQCCWAGAEEPKLNYRLEPGQNYELKLRHLSILSKTFIFYRKKSWLLKKFL